MDWEPITDEQLEQLKRAPGHLKLPFVNLIARIEALKKENAELRAASIVDKNACPCGSTTWRIGRYLGTTGNYNKFTVVCDKCGAFGWEDEEHGVRP